LPVVRPAVVGAREAGDANAHGKDEHDNKDDANNGRRAQFRIRRGDRRIAHDDGTLPRTVGLGHESLQLFREVVDFGVRHVFMPRLSLLK
jgi:hypothetical protein